MNLALERGNAVNVFSIIAQREKFQDAFSLLKWKGLITAQLISSVREEDKATPVPL